MPRSAGDQIGPHQILALSVAGGIGEGWKARAAPEQWEGASDDVSSRDGRRFSIDTVSGDPASTPTTVVLNWTAGLKK